jgi:hypothetical protein
MNWLRAVLFAGGLVVAFQGVPAAEFDQVIDTKITKLQEGKELTDEDYKEASSQFNAFADALTKKNESHMLMDWPAEDQARHYVAATKMAIVDLDNYGGSPLRHPGMRKAYPIIKQWLEKNDDPYLMTALIIPALVHDDAQLAIATFKRLEAKKPYLSAFILNYAREYYLRGATIPFIAGVENSGSRKHPATNGPSSTVSQDKAPARRP